MHTSEPSQPRAESTPGGAASTVVALFAWMVLLGTRAAPPALCQAGPVIALVLAIIACVIPGSERAGRAIALALIILGAAWYAFSVFAQWYIFS
jgi:hypothetical protein